jgi:hypothetical protein
MGLIGCGSAAAAIGGVATIEGQPVIGVPVIVIGTAMIIAGVRDAKKEIQSAMEIQGAVAVRQHEIDQIDSQQVEPERA